MFDLKKEITKWRMRLSEKQTCDKSDLDELESHLEDEIDQLKLKGLSEQEAFFVAAHRLGDTDELACEFAKVNRSLVLRKKLFYAGCGIFAYIAATYTAKVILQLSIYFAVTLGLQGITAGTFGSVLSLILIGLIIVLFYAIIKRKGFKGEWFSRKAGSLKGEMILIGIVFISMIAMTAFWIIFPAIMVHSLGINKYSQIVITTAYVGQITWLIVPVILMMLLIRLRKAKDCNLA